MQEEEEEEEVVVVEEEEVFTRENRGGSGQQRTDTLKPLWLLHMNTSSSDQAHPLPDLRTSASTSFMPLRE